MKRHPREYYTRYVWKRLEPVAGTVLERVEEIPGHGHISVKPRTILDGQCRNVRAKACLCVHGTIWRGCALTDHWPVAGRDTIQIRERVYNIAAVQRLDYDDPAHVAYEVFLR